MTTQLEFARDAQSAETFAPSFTDGLYSCSVATSTATALTVPGTTELYVAIFSYSAGSDVWVSNNQTAAVPASSSFATTTSSLNPTARIVEATDVLSFYTTDSTVSVGVEFYAI
ncbi:MAG: hypothetical protein ACTSP4_00485 [Candidatus Hodarchaeales archaeon]